MISEIEFLPVKPRNNFIGFVSFVYDDLFYFSSIGVYKALDGTSYSLSYPYKKLGNGKIQYFHPIDKEVATIILDKVTIYLNELFDLEEES
jgi:hypothetical protein